MHCKINVFLIASMMIDHFKKKKREEKNDYHLQKEGNRNPTSESLEVH